LLVIVGYVAWAFRKVSRPIASWKYGAVSIVALFHDIMIVVGVFALLGRYAGVEIDSAFIAALLTVLGYSVNDTIVVLDRVRENLPRSNEDFLGTVDTSISQTVARSINTTLTTVLALLALLFFGGETIHYFILALTIGITSGAYSSIFIAAPLLILWEKWGRRS
jgi:preprotein translocase subunit SecF